VPQSITDNANYSALGQYLVVLISLKNIRVIALASGKSSGSPRHSSSRGCKPNHWYVSDPGIVCDHGPPISPAGCMNEAQSMS